MCLESLNQWKKEIENRIVVAKNLISGIKMTESEYKQGKSFPDIASMRPFDSTKEFWNGKADSHAWFAFCVQTPKADTHTRFELQFEVDKARRNPQFLVYLNGELAEGLDYEHRVVRLQAETNYEVFVYAYGGAEVDDKFFTDIYFAACDERVESLYDDLRVALDSIALLDRNDREYIRAVACLEKAVAYIDLYESNEAFMESVEKALAFMETEFYGKICGREDMPKVTCIGHTHIDVAWLWTLEQTREKVQHSFANTVKLMDEFPEYRFMSSQPQLYEFAKEEDPVLYAKMKEKIASGVWECEGASWLEFDCNLPSGESFIRQFLFGKRFFKEEFGKDSRVAWLPDSFGFSPCLPQIFKKCGVERFVTSKISWNEEHALPDDLFLWRGNDGSEIFAYCLTAQDKAPQGTFLNRTRYSGLITPTQVYGCYDRFRNKDLFDGALMPYGFGDGGGGANRLFLRTLRRLSEGLPKLPVAKNGTLEEFFKSVDESVAGKKLPVWNGELYLELHRGVHTTMEAIKRGNRQAEFGLRSAEWLASLAEIYYGVAYPKVKLDKAWKTLLLNQFHDILSGTCLKEACERAATELQRVRAEAEEVIADSLKGFIDTTAKQNTAFIWNPTGATSASVRYDGACRYFTNLAENGYTVATPCEIENSVQADTTGMENAFFRVALDENGSITSVYDKRAERELVKSGRRLGELIAFDDNPHEFEAWEIKAYAYNRAYPIRTVSVTKIRDGARAGVEVVKKLHGSTIRQKIYLYEKECKIDFETEVDWQESRVMLKAGFPIDTVADTFLTETQYGYQERPLYLSNEWERTHFEVVAHKYAAIAEGGYSFGVLNDGKYGYGVHDGELNITLLRSPIYPNPDSDKGLRKFTYSFYACEKPFADSGIATAARLLNDPPRVFEGGANGEACVPFVACAQENIVLETLKKSEDGNGYILRVYENGKRVTNAEIVFDFQVGKAELCDMLENAEQEIAVIDGRKLRLRLKPFEAVTVRLTGVVKGNK